MHREYERRRSEFHRGEAARRFGRSCGDRRRRCSCTRTAISAKGSSRRIQGDQSLERVSAVCASGRALRARAAEQGRSRGRFPAGSRTRAGRREGERCDGRFLRRDLRARKRFRSRRLRRRSSVARRFRPRRFSGSVVAVRDLRARRDLRRRRDRQDKGRRVGEELDRSASPRGDRRRRSARRLSIGRVGSGGAGARVSPDPVSDAIRRAPPIALSIEVLARERDRVPPRGACAGDSHGEEVRLSHGDFPRRRTRSAGARALVRFRFQEPEEARLDDAPRDARRPDVEAGRGGDQNDAEDPR